MNQSLYNLLADMQSLLDDTEGGELTWQLEQVEALEGKIEDKIAAYCQLIEEAKMRALAKSEQIKRLQERRAVDENLADRLKDQMHRAMAVHGIRKINTDLFLVYTQRNPPCAECVVDVSLLPEEFVRIKREPDKAAALRWWRENGETPPPGFEVTQSESVRIK